MLESYEFTLSEDDDAVNGDEVEVDAVEIDAIEGSTLDTPEVDEIEEVDVFVTDESPSQGDDQSSSDTTGSSYTP